MQKRILVVEDEPDIREAMAEALVDAGFEVLTAQNGQEGLDTALTAKPDLILLDIIMPILDGHGMLQQLRQDPWGQDAKVVMLTSMDDVKNIASAHEGAITDYIIKAHSSLDEIVNKVRLIIHM
jgi:DNA-binding response OmpR family regulator